ncbi:MAG: hypothetical protein R3186_04390 [Ruegeria sp.]|nr:hypothetical protein [Ruegeria sp.]
MRQFRRFFATIVWLPKSLQFDNFCPLSGVYLSVSPQGAARLKKRNRKVSFVLNSSRISLIAAAIAKQIGIPEEKGPWPHNEQDNEMKMKSRFLCAVLAATREHQLEMPWKRVSSQSVRVARRMAARR